MTTTTFESLPADLIRNVPEVKDQIELGIADCRRATGEDPTPDYVFGGLLVLEVVRLSAQLPDGPAEDRLSKIYHYIEELLASENDAVRDVADVSFAEQLASHPDAVRKTARLMRKRLLSAVQRQ